MKNTLIFILLFISGCHFYAKGQAYFKIDSLELEEENLVFAKKGWKINLNSESGYSLGYPSKKELVEDKADDGILGMVEELLSFKGDKRKCIKKVSCYNRLISERYKGDNKIYTIELEALFLINQIFFDEPFNYSPYPVLVKEDCSDCDYNSLIDEAFQYYEKWFKEIKRIGLKEAQKKKIYPLSNSSLSWFGALIY